MGDEILERLVAFGRELRDEGMLVGTGQMLEFSRAAALLGPADFYWVGRATLVIREVDIKTYNIVFDRYWSGDSGRPVQHRQIVERVRSVAEEDGPEGGQKGRDTNLHAQQASRLELLRATSFSELTDDELHELAGMMARFSLLLPTRPSRRRQAARRGEPDVRRTLRRSMRTGGEPIERAWRDRRRRRRRVVFILDISRSMTSYSRGLLIFAHAALRADARWEAFCFGTRLTRITRVLNRTDPTTAIHRAAAEVVDWNGGTRIGESLKVFLDRFGHGGMARGAVVVICSDGLEVGDPGLLEQQMVRLHRLAYRIVWLNPLQEHEGYRPTAHGMQAALPHIDTFACGSTMDSLATLTRELAQT
jgi:hypothetical protein